MRHHRGVAYEADAEGGAPQNLVEAIGGPLGFVETSVPPVAFVAAYSLSGSDTALAAGVALGVALVLAIVRLARRESPHQTLYGLVGIGFAAFIAAKSGRAENFFLPGLLANAAYATACLVSVAIGRPLIGLVAGAVTGESGWREVPARARAYARATLLWAGLFLFRLAVQLPLYLAGACGWRTMRHVIHSPSANSGRPIAVRAMPSASTAPAR